MPSSLKILFIYKFLTVGGVETVIRNRLEGFLKLGVHGEAWFLQYVDGQPVLDPRNPSIHVGNLPALDSHLANNHYDVLCSIDTEEVFPLLGKYRQQSSIILESHSPYFENLEYLRFLDNARFDAILVPSQHQREVVEKLTNNMQEIIVVPNPLSASFDNTPHEFSPKPPKAVVAWIGRLDYLKNWKEFLILVSHIDQYDLEYEIWLIGRSPRPDVASHLYRYACKLGVISHLRWYNNVPYSMMPNFLDAVRTSGGVVVSTSRGESFGMTVVEAMARACPVIVPDKKPFVEYVRHGETGYVYSLGHPAMGAERVVDLINSEAIRDYIGKCSREQVLSVHSQRNAVQAYVDVMRRIQVTR